MKSPPLPPVIEEFFSQQRQQQKTFNNIALINKDLRETTNLLQGSVLEKLCDRERMVDDLEGESTQLLNSSSDFLFETLPWYKQCFVGCCCCCCITTTEDKGLNETRPRIIPIRFHKKTF